MFYSVFFVVCHAYACFFDVIVVGPECSEMITVAESRLQANPQQIGKSP